RFTPTYPDTDSVAVVRFSVRPDSASGAGDLRQGVSEVVANAAALGVDPPAIPKRLRLAVTPNPARGEIRLFVTLPVAGRYRLEVLDILGRLVHTEMMESGSAAELVRPWNMIGPRGVRTGAGVYFARLSGPAGHVVTRFVLQR